MWKSLVYIQNLGQNIWNKVKKSSEIGELDEFLIYASTKFLAAITKVLHVKGTLDIQSKIRQILPLSTLRLFAKIAWLIEIYGTFKDCKIFLSKTWVWAASLQVTIICH